MNAGAYVTGSQLKRLGEYYAKAIHDNYGLDFDVLFGPAYKGIPLSVVTAIAIHDLYGVEVRYCSNRKEAKDHGGDAGLLLGSKIKDGDRVVIIEDVTTSGKSIEETFPIIQAQGNAARFYFYSFLYYHKRLCFSSPDTGFRIKNIKSTQINFIL